MSRRSKAVPSVMDLSFGIRVPSFLVVHGFVLHRRGAGTSASERVMRVGDTALYRKHGWFQIRCISEGYAVIAHMPRSSCKQMELLLPKGKWLHVSNGSYKVSEPNFKSYEEGYAHLVDEPKVIHPSDLLGKYMVLLDTFRNYWKKNFEESVQEDTDSQTHDLGSRIRYGLTCVHQCQPIPPDCEHDRLLEQLHEVIEYYENA